MFLCKYKVKRLFVFDKEFCIYFVVLILEEG